MGRRTPTIASLVHAELTRQVNDVIIDLRDPIALRIEPGERDVRTPTYRHLARSYDTATTLFNAFRARAVELLQLTSGQVVLDVGCGTGLCFSYMQERIGPTGWIIGIDRSAEMLAQADVRCARKGWRNVTLIESDAESVDIGASADAALFCAAHDILQSPNAIRNVLGHVRPGGRCAAVGAKWAPPWFAGLNVLTALAHRPFVGSFAGFDKPWAVLIQFVPQLHVTETAFGAGYTAVGCLGPD
ncbi:MAG TPA: methyltransferase domain-containing protein [Acidimicrobiales bacterium]|nr:methyltransferase domain-containing protein [Acidimicrobiales bacterium]